jgi:GMP synthase-like glutamine amidotransferase
LARVLIVQHVEPEGPARIAEALARAGHVVAVHRSDLDGDPPVPDGHDGVVVMGGPMSAASDDAFPTRPAELELLRTALGRGLPTLGVCLGAQLLALAAGGEVHRGDAGPEIGWGPITLHEETAHDPLLRGRPPTLEVLHWHGDTFTLPPGAALLASSGRYPHQAFRVGERAWGLQFHLEVDAAAVERFVDAFAHETPDGGAAILAATPAALDALTPHADVVLDRFAALLG